MCGIHAHSVFRQTSRQAAIPWGRKQKQAGRQVYRQASRQTRRQTCRQTDRQRRQTVPRRGDRQDGDKLKDRGSDKALRKTHAHTHRDRQQTGWSFHGSFCRGSGEGNGLSADGIFITSGSGFATQSQLRSSETAGTDLGYTTHTERIGTFPQLELAVPTMVMKALSPTCHSPTIQPSPAASQRLHKMAH